MTPTFITCEDFRYYMSQGREASDVVGWLAVKHGVERSAIYNRLRRGGVLPPYGTRHNLLARVMRKTEPLTAEEIPARRVYRDPCPRCGTRGDIPCGHNHSPLSNVVFAA